MRRLRSNPIRPLIATILALGLSICCCQVHFLVQACADPAATPARTVAASCCVTCPTEAPAGPLDDAPSAPRDDTPDGPLDGCGSCCIKGTGLKNLDAKTATLDLTPFPVVVAPTIVLGPASVLPPRHPAPATVHLEPRTLFTLHCALLV